MIMCSTKNKLTGGVANKWNYVYYNLNCATDKLGAVW